MFLAWSGMSSKKSDSSTTLTISSLMSYGLLGLSGTRVSSDISIRSTVSSVGTIGGFSLLLDGMKLNRRRVIIRASTSFSKARSATPDLVV